MFSEDTHVNRTAPLTNNIHSQFDHNVLHINRKDKSILHDNVLKPEKCSQCIIHCTDNENINFCTEHVNNDTALICKASSMPSLQTDIQQNNNVQ